MRSGGFTLMELMVVLAIFAVLSTVVSVSMVPALKDARMRSACRMLASSLNYAHSHAVSHNISTRLVIDADREVEIQAYKSAQSQNDAAQWTTLRTAAGRLYVLPEGVQVTQISKSGGSSDENWVEFTGTGLAEQVRIEVSNDDGLKKYITVDQITGRSAIRSEREQQEYEESDTILQVR